MAQPIPFQPRPFDEPADLQLRLQTARIEHGEALLSAYQVLQEMQNQGVLEILRGGLGSRDEVMETVVEAINNPAAIRGMRNLMILINTLGEIDPAQLKSLAKALPPAVEQLTTPERPPGLWHSLRNLAGWHSWRRPAAAVAAFFQNLDSPASSSAE